MENFPCGPSPGQGLFPFSLWQLLPASSLLLHRSCSVPSGWAGSCRASNGLWGQCPLCLQAAQQAVSQEKSVSLSLSHSQAPTDNLGHTVRRGPSQNPVTAVVSRSLGQLNGSDSRAVSH